MRRALAVVGILLFLVLAVRRFVPSIPLQLTNHERGETPDPTKEPEQDEIARPTPIPLASYGMELTPRAHYDISAEVVSTARYRFDTAAGFIPWDLALIWGDLVEKLIRSSLSYSQSARFYFWSTTNFIKDRAYIVSHSANVHVIPASSTVRSVLAHVRPGDRVRLQGDLVDVDGTGSHQGFHWGTSLSRDDTDAGACETMYVTCLNVNGKVYR